MQTNLFHPKTFEEAKEAAVGSCNGLDRNTRWLEETPLFCDVIIKQLKNQTPQGKIVIDFGCGPGRISKELLIQSDIQHLDLTVIGIDTSPEMLRIAQENINHKNFIPLFPHELNQKIDLVCLVYCLQHMPAIEIREVLQRIYTFLKDDGRLVYCSSDYRMAITKDKGFFDDRFLGVNLKKELDRYFVKVCDAFTKEELDANPTVKKMVEGQLPHPAIIYKKKEIKGYLFNAGKDAENFTSINISKPIEYKKLILKNRLSPGDILVMTCALRALHKTYPNEYITDVESPAPEIFQNSPYITKLDQNASDVKVIDMMYPEIHKSGESGKHFSDGHRLFLAKEINRPIPQCGMRPDIFLNQDELLWLSPVAVTHGYNDKYWVINAGSKDDYALKQYFYYQEVVDILKDRIKFVQIGHTVHRHDILNDVIDMRGKTNLRELFRLIYHAEGVLTCVSLPMHTAAAFSKPCVVVALGRESVRWEMYQDHRYLAVNGTLSCCRHDGCWESAITSCKNLIEDPLKGKIPKCQKLITPKMVSEAILMYYYGDILSFV